MRAQAMMPALRHDARAAALGLALLAYVLLAVLLAQGSARLTWRAEDAAQPGLLYLRETLVPAVPAASPAAAAQVERRSVPVPPASSPLPVSSESMPSAPAAPAGFADEAAAAGSLETGRGGAAYGMQQPDQRAGLAEQVGPAVPKEKWARFRRDVGSAYVPDCLHTDALKNQHTAEGDCQLCFKGLAAAPAVAVAKLKGQCK